MFRRVVQEFKHYFKPVICGHPMIKINHAFTKQLEDKNQMCSRICKDFIQMNQAFKKNEIHLILKCRDISKKWKEKIKTMSTK